MHDTEGNNGALGGVLEKLAPYVREVVAQPSRLALHVEHQEVALSVLTKAHVRLFDRDVVIFEVARMLEKGITLSREVVEELMRIYFASNLSLYGPNHAITERFHQEYPELGLSSYEAQAILSQNSILQDFYAAQHPGRVFGPVPEGLFKRFPEGIHDIDDADGIRIVMFEALAELPVRDRLAAFRYFIHLCSLFGGEEPETVMCTTAFISKLDNLPEQIKMYGTILEMLYQHATHPEAFEIEPDEVDKRAMEAQDMWDKEFSSADSRWDVAEDAFEAEDSFVCDFMWDLATFSFNHEPYFRALLELPQDRMHTLVGLFMRYAHGYADVLNALRLVTESEEGDRRTRLERLGKELLGFEPDDARPFHTCLEDVYAQADFSHYAGYVSTQATDERVLQNMAQSSPRATIVDLGCGDGRLSNWLAGKLECGSHIIGVDVAEPELEKARMQATQHGIEARVTYQTGSMLNLELEPASVDCVYTLGRTLTHVDDGMAFERVVRGVCHILKPGGVWIFDLPDPNRGGVYASRQHVGKVFEAFGVKSGPILSIGRTVDYVVDTPDGKHFYNRYVPQFDEVRRSLEWLGFEVEVIDSAQLVGPSYRPEDKNMYFRARKKNDFTPLTPYRGPNSKEQAWSLLWKGDE